MNDELQPSPKLAALADGKHSALADRKAPAGRFERIELRFDDFVARAAGRSQKTIAKIRAAAQFERPCSLRKTEPRQRDERKNEEKKVLFHGKKKVIGCKRAALNRPDETDSPRNGG